MLSRVEFRGQRRSGGAGRMFSALPRAENLSGRGHPSSRCHLAQTSPTPCTSHRHARRQGRRRHRPQGRLARRVPLATARPLAVTSMRDPCDQDRLACCTARDTLAPSTPSAAITAQTSEDSHGLTIEKYTLQNDKYHNCT